MGHILVTGAGGGMGRSAVSELAALGHVVFAADIKPCEAGEGVIPVLMDVTDEGSVSAALDAVRAVTDSLDAIIHFAGIYTLDSLVEIGSAELERAFRVNLFGACLVNRTFLPMLRAGGRIVITTSELATLDPLPFTGVYAVTKGALDSYAYSLRMELQLLGVTVSVLRAGAVDTGMLGASTDALDRFCENTRLYACNSARFKRIVEGVEARRVPPARIAREVVRILGARSPRFAYSVNRNPLLLLMSTLPKRLQLWIIRMILK